MLRAVTEKKQKKALDLYYDLLALKEPPMRILFLLARQFNLIWQVKELEKEGYDQCRIAKRTGLQPLWCGITVPMEGGIGKRTGKDRPGVCGYGRKGKDGTDHRYPQCGIAPDQIQQLKKRAFWPMTDSQKTLYFYSL